MKCNRCRGPAVIEVRRHNAAYCKDCFIHVFREQVKRAIRQHDMFAAEDRILVAVSGGKDSLALWDVLLDLGYDADRALPRAGDRRLLRPLGRRDAGRSRPSAARSSSPSTWNATTASTSRPRVGRARDRRAPSAGCRSGTSSTAPRWRAGSTSSRPGTTWTTRRRRCWATRCAGRPSTSPASRRPCPAKAGMVKKVKPLFRLSELETAAYAFLRGIDYVVEECPLVAGNTQLRYKDAMNAIESTSPGTKAQFFLGYLERGRPLFTAADDAVLSRVRTVRPAHDRDGSARSAGPGRRSSGSGSDRLRMSTDGRSRRGGRARRRGHARRDLRGERRERRSSRASACMLVDQRDRTYLMTLQAGGTYHTHSGTLPHDDLLGQARGHARGDVEGHGDDGVPPALRGLRAEDAARRAGGLSEGPRPDHDVRGHLPGRARAGGGDRLRGAHDRAVPGDRARRPRRLVRAARGASRPGDRERRGVLREVPRSARTARRGRRGVFGHRRSLRSMRPGPARAVGARSARCIR